MKETKYYNYISFSDRQRIIASKSSFSLTRDRVFEYTTPIVEQVLRSLNQESLKYLESLPTFLCSEEDNSGIYISGGKISNLEYLGGTIRFDFQSDFEINVSSSELDLATENKSLADIFGIDGFQLYRTHWSVTKGDYKGIVDQLSSVFPSLKVPGNSFGFSPKSPPESKETDPVAKSLVKFLEAIEGLNSDATVEYFFRGHSNATYGIVPSLFRSDKDGRPVFSEDEEQLCKDLIMEHSDEFQNDKTCFDRLVRMQHYGLPTRLLDLTRNPLMALYFACEDADGKKSGTAEERGQVLVFGVKKSSIKYSDSDTVRCIANLSQLSAVEKNNIRDYPTEFEFNESAPIAKLLDYIRSEKGHFLAKINAQDLRKFVCVKAKMTNERIRSQQGAFLLFGLTKRFIDEGLEETIDGVGEISVKRINIENKTAILEQLSVININAAAVYPSLTKSIEHIKNRYENRGKV